MRKDLDKSKYKNKFSMYDEVLKEYFPEPCEIFILTKFRKLNFIETIIDTFIAPEVGLVETAYELGDLLPYYLVKKR